jgi:hypothetical protein
MSLPKRKTPDEKDCSRSRACGALRETSERESSALLHQNGQPEGNKKAQNGHFLEVFHKKIRKSLFDTNTMITFAELREEYVKKY